MAMVKRDSVCEKILVCQSRGEFNRVGIAHELFGVAIRVFVVFRVKISKNKNITNQTQGYPSAKFNRGNGGQTISV